MVSFLPQLSFGILKEAELFYRETGSFSNEVLEQLHSFFGEILVLATELLEKCKIIQYQTQDGCREVYKICTYKEQFTIYKNINFCQCDGFRLQVLDSRSKLTCKHVLAVNLAKIMNNVKSETITDSQFTDFLNEQINYIEV